MNRKEVKEFLETLHFHGYIDHDITKLDNLIDDYYPKQSEELVCNCPEDARMHMIYEDDECTICGKKF